MHEFTDKEGGRPLVGLVESSNGSLYGATTEGGAHERGSVYQLTPDRRFKVMHSFNREEGAYPLAAMTEGGDGYLYSTTRHGGHKNRGVIYKLSADGRNFTILHSFSGADGANPEAELARGADGFLYGVASHGGAEQGGAAFRIRADGSDFAVLHEFDKCDIENPYAPGGTRPTMLLASNDGYLYGATRKGGDENQGAVFRMRIDGSDYRLLHSFSGYGRKQLIEDADGRIVVPVREGDKRRVRLKSIEELESREISIQTQGMMQAQTVFTVTNAADSGPGSLRQAIIDANNNPGKDEIHFFILGGGVHTIAPISELPVITDPVIIDALTQPGASNANWPPALRIQIDGNNTFQKSGLSIDTDDCLIRGLVINRFRRGIGIGGNNNQIKCNFIGTDPTGIFDRGNTDEGIAVVGDANIIGGATSAERNLVSANDNGIRIDIGDGNLILGNYIGTNVFGNNALGNTHYGIFIVNSSDNQIGGTAAGARNVISGNGIIGSAIGIGVYMVGNSTGNHVLNNFIGTNSAGDAAVPNTFSGVNIGNFPGSNSIGATDNLVGGTASGSRNVISGNVSAGVAIRNGNRAVGNYIGVDATGSAALGNDDAGISIAGADNEIGGATAAERNIISGNRHGIRIFDTDSTGNVIEGNYIGADATGMFDLGNTDNGIQFRDGSPSGNLIGGTSVEARNIISGNGTGISFGTVADPSSSPTGNFVQGNYIGLSAAGAPLGNSLEGVFIRDYSHNNIIGGTAPGAGNVIAYNGDGGIHIARTPLANGASAIPTGNSILGNSIFENYDLASNPYPGLGIDLNQVAAVGGDGVTENDPGDADAGPNNLQNFPVLAQGPNGSLICSLNSTPNRSFRIEFFASDAADPSGYGEGEVFIASQNVTTDASGNVNFTFTPPQTPGKPVITATATDNQTGDTSEFSLAFVAVALQPPTLFCPSDIGVSTDANQCSAVVNLNLYVAASDGSGGSLTPVCAPPSGSAFQKGTTTVSCTATNAAGSASCSFPVTVIDTQQPSIQCPANILQAAPADQCVATVNYATPTATDNCPGVSVVCTPPAGGALFSVGTTSVACVATDAGGLQRSCFFTVTITDATAPAIQCPTNIATSTAPNQCAAAVNYAAPTATDCSAVNAPVCAPPSGSIFSKGVTTVTCAATDASGNTANCSFTVTVNDNQPPQIVCPSNIVATNAQGLCSALAAYPAPSVMDNCPGAGAAVCNPPSGSTFQKGVTTVNCSAADASGNTASCAFTVTVVDTQAPTISCPANLTLVAQGGCQGQATGAILAYSPPSANDNCSAVTVICAPPSGSVCPAGVMTVVCTASDAAGNTSACSFTVTGFDVCLQDDSNPAVSVLFSSQTAEYRFCVNGQSYTGAGTVTIKGCVITLTHNTPTRRVLVKIDRAQLKGTGSLQSPPGALQGSITDSNTTNNTCSCQ